MAQPTDNKNIGQIIMKHIKSVLSLSVALFASSSMATETNFNPVTRANPLIVSAISLAESAIKNTKAIEVEEESRYDDKLYRVDLVNAEGKMTNVYLDMESTTIIHYSAITLPSFIESINKSWYKNVDQEIYRSLTSAINQAEKDTGMNALRADFDFDEGYDFYEVDLIDSQGNKHELHISPLETTFPDCIFPDLGGPGGMKHFRGHKH